MFERPSNMNAHKWRQARKMVLTAAGQWESFRLTVEGLRRAGVKNPDATAEGRYGDTLERGGAVAIYNGLLGSAAEVPPASSVLPPRAPFVATPAEKPRVRADESGVISKEQAERLGWSSDPSLVKAPTADELLWVASSLAVELEPSDCPHLALWAMLLWARANPRDFWSMMGKSFFQGLAEESKKRGRGSGKHVRELVAKLRAAAAAVEEVGDEGIEGDTDG